MSNWNDAKYIQQGWQCPVCGAVYSPMTMFCMNCTGWKVSNKATTTTGNAPIDMLNNNCKWKPVEEDKPKYSPDYENWDNKFRNS